MIPNVRDRVVESSGVAQSAEFGISIQDSAHVMTILRDTLYSDKVLAVLREYSSNAWDANREAGKGNVPIKVTLPTPEDPTLYIRDFGKGLSHEDVFQVYTQYGASTKRGSDISVGMLGIGSKSGFAYSDSFVITSHHNGMARTYVAVLDKSEKGVINLLGAQTSDETGVEIRIAIRPKDISEFVQKAQNLYQYFLPVPQTNVPISPRKSSHKPLQNGIIYDSSFDTYGGSWVAVMGCVPYRINLDQLKKRDEDEEEIADFADKLSGALYFNIGEVRISASREELKYDDSTRKSIVNRFNLLMEEYVKELLHEIEQGPGTPWEKRLKARHAISLGIPLGTTGGMSGEYVSWKVKDAPDSFSVYRDTSEVDRLHIHHTTKVLLRDENKRALKGYRLGVNDYLIHLSKTASWDKAEKELGEFFETLGLTGIHICKLSDQTWTPKNRSCYSTREYSYNSKHRQRIFKFVPSDHFASAFSRYWEPVDREPTKDDVFVILEEFKTPNASLYNNYSFDAFLFTIAGAEHPVIYGYKSTGKRPIKKEDCVGVFYKEWREKILDTLLLEPLKKRLDSWRWASVIDTRAYWAHRGDRGGVQKAAKYFGKDHPLLVFASKVIEAQNSNAADNSTYLLERAYALVKDRIKFEAEIEYEKLIEKYPLLNAAGIHPSMCWGKDAKAWAQYITSVDALTEKQTGEESDDSSIHPDE